MENEVMNVVETVGTEVAEKAAGLNWKVVGGIAIGIGVVTVVGLGVYYIQKKKAAKKAAVAADETVESVEVEETEE